MPVKAHPGVFMNSALTTEGLGNVGECTIPEAFLRRCESSAGAHAYMQFSEEKGKWVGYTWGNILSQAARFQSLISTLSLTSGDRVSIMLPNCIEWPIFDLASMGLGYITVPLHTNEGSENVVHILGETEAKLLFIHGQSQWDTVKEYADSHPGMHVVSLEHVDDPRVSSLDSFTPSSSNQTYQTGSKNPQATATIVYTSGTTSKPKGVVLSHHNLLWNAWACGFIAPALPNDLFLSFLPMSHVFERTVGYYFPMLRGSTVAYARKTETVAQDFRLVSPSVMLTVPHVLEKVYSHALCEISKKNRAMRWFCSKALEHGWQMFCYKQEGIVPDWGSVLLHKLFYFTLYRRFGAVFGKRLRLMVSGGAPLPYRLGKFFVSMGIPVLQGYGMTETAPVISSNTLESNNIKSVGKLLPGLSANIGKDGELRVKSPGVMKGYWENTQATKDVFDKDGWFRTGDIARIDGDTLFIEGRKKEIIVLSTGKKVPCSPVEAELLLLPFIDQVLIAEDNRPYLIALIVPHQPFFHIHKIHTEAEKSGYAMKIIRRALASIPKESQVKKIAFCKDPWTQKNGLITATFKPIRKKILATYRTEVESLYTNVLH